MSKARRSCGPRHAEGPWPERVRNQLGHGGASQQDEQPDGDELQRGQQPFCLGQQAEHHQAEAEIVGLGQGVQAGERVGKPQQPDGPRQEEEGAGADRQDGEDIDARGSCRSVSLRVERRR